MIGSRALAAALAIAVALLMGGGGPRPEIAMVATAAVDAAVEQALELADRLARDLSPALRSARRGAAGVVAGQEDPALRLEEAADLTGAATAVADPLRSAFDDLVRARAATVPNQPTLPMPPDGERLATIAGQLRAVAPAASEFVAARRSADEATDLLAAALQTAETGDTDGAREALGRALAALDEVRPWERSSVALPVWIDTVDAMIRAMQRLIDAIDAGDADAARAATAEFQAAAGGATQADRALRIGLDEAGAGLAAGPVGELAEAAATTDELRTALRDLQAGAGE